MTQLSANPFAALLLDASVKALLLLAVAYAIAIVLRRAMPRARALVWSVALVGAVALPALTRTLPAIHLGLMPTPVETSNLPVVGSAGPAVRASSHAPAPVTLHAASTAQQAISTNHDAPDPRLRAGWPWWRAAVLLWSLGAAIFAVRYVRAFQSVSALTRRSRPLFGTRWSRRLQLACSRAGVTRRVRLLECDETRTPLTWGGLRPVILLPTVARTWSAERLDVVLLHEMVHIARLDWMTRMVARMACAFYWFNPLSWLALRRLEAEQELACDEEVLAHGTRASTYATHLLDIARAVAIRAAPQPVALGMARRSQMEGRIMAVLNTNQKNRVTLTRIAPLIALMLILIPGIASVQPWGAASVAETSSGTGGSHEASAEVKRLMAEIARVEKEMEPTLAELEDVEIDMAPVHEALEGFEIDMAPYEEQLAAIEKEMAPLLEKMSDVEIDMAPFAEHMAMIEDKMAPWREIEVELHRRMEPLYEALRDFDLEDFDSEEFGTEMERLHADLEPLREELEMMRENLEPFREEMARLHEEMESVHIDMEPFHERMEAFHEKMEPFHREMERLGDQLENELVDDLAVLIRDSMGGAAAADAPYDAIAREVLDEAHIHITDDVLSLRISTRETREILRDALSSHRNAGEDEFERAVERTVDAIADYEVHGK